MMWRTIAARCIYQKNDIQIYQNWMYRWLTCGSSALQTMLNRYHPHKPVLNYIASMTKLACLMPGSVCLLGLGGAGAAHALAPYLEKFNLTAVEYHLDIITVARDYFMVAQIENMTIVHQDAYQFVQNTTLQYQHVMVDLFNADAFPEHCNTHQFFEQCRRILLPEGILAVNIANRLEQWNLFSTIRKSFPKGTIVIPIKNCMNMIVLGYNGTSVNDLLTTLKCDKQLKQLVWDPKWGYIAQFKR